MPNDTRTDESSRKKRFNQENVNVKIREIEALPENQRKSETKLIRNNLRQYLENNFTFSEAYQRVIQDFPPSLMDEFGVGIAMVLERDSWKLTVKMPDGDPPAPARLCPSKQEVKGEWGDDGYNVSKTVTWEF